MTVDIDSLAVKELREISSLAGRTSATKKPRSHSIPVGEAVFIRTVTMFYTGRIESVTASDIKLVDAAWIADSGRFHDALKSGKLNEVEPFPSWVVIPRGCIVDISPWSHELPKKQL